ncbi:MULTISPECIES: YgiQ family radical SAM protein [unclassified Clostridioides]|uniref:YgiQ family radical SAM protein n=1 Tax=unclassified Clostridioides TaxID=2635829 RepID=UPI001D0FA9A3|nr:YgiQ family radical SAM protein [Clostridioides sp. ES-S-0049-03]MCC0673432.1 YgiQ family radical SAM protein [Clostridioides sp. ES-S-0145-01]MCC0676214.1 YgiQ family radical SAM protein [Clostridioides sp. ES-W-0018-02]MCC0706561.1 YgiQ family radical SAM protein [Clostridioides sp. ES-S-0190-01]MCC0710707.1 YgiQ family radical SAM protein [Clostridioides sp. ES-W-0017-02]UDN57602.1 YgiQ family radical SAM protein [Clostridioides sp. ES-S-0010-02]UDN62806.1 YgiQ family radical SAM protei
MENRFLPISKQDMIDRGWEELDFVLVTGDAYVDHHSFGTAIISRVLENAGYKVGIIAQPNWKTTDDFMKLGKPRLGFLVNAGNMDSMVNHYSVSKKHRDKDMYSPGGKMGYRPDRATIVYCNKIREAYSDVAIVIGGIEASLRRFAHYDYWSDKVRKSMLIDSGADLLVYGMSEKQIVDVANALNDGYDPKYIRHIDGTCYVADTLEEIYDNYILIPSYKEICEDKMKYVEAFKIQYDEQDPFRGNIIVQPHGSKYLVQNKPEKPLNREELDEVYGLPYQKTYHPVYEKSGGIPAIEEVKFSIVSSRGCFGSCSFCAITFHQGRAVQSRSEKSIIDEAVGITKLNDFKGYIHDVGGPTANFRRPACNKQITKGACKNRQCLSPSPCKNLDADHSEYLHLLRAVRKLPNIKKVFVRSGIRYDYVMADKNNKFLRELIEHHVSGQLKVAPEHISEEVLEYMQKPAGKTYDKFRQKFFAINEELGKKQYLIPYLMSSHPGSTLNSAIELAEYLRDTHYQPEQVQDFYPTPGTLSTTMFYTGIDPLTMKPVYVPKSKRDKAMQRALLQYRAPRNYDLVYSALVEAGREDLIGFGHRCLIKPKDEKPYFNRNNSNKNKSKSSTENKKYNANNRNNKKQQKSPSKRKKKY